MKKILIIGTLPSTAGVGGVTIHVQRLLHYLEDNSPNICDFLDYKQTNFFTLLNLIRKHKYIHVHLSNPYVRLIITLWACLFWTKVITTFHGNYSNLKFIKKIILIATLKLTHTPITINQSSYKLCLIHNPKTILLPAFIPPINEHLIDKSLLELINNIHASGKILVSTNASDLVYDDNGKEIYGIKFLIDYFSTRLDFTLLISDPTGKNKAKYGTTSSNILYVDFPHNYYEILKRTDIFIRNTSTDGDSISIKESLYIGCRTICSNVINRPDGCILFHYNDADSLTKAINSAMEAGKTPIPLENGAIRLKELYSQLTS